MNNTNYWNNLIYLFSTLTLHTSAIIKLETWNKEHYSQCGLIRHYFVYSIGDPPLKIKVAKLHV